MVVRARSLADVTSLVWSTRLKPTRSASARVACRTATTSAELRMSRVSCDSAAITVLRKVQRRPEQSHASLYVEGGAHSGERQTELHQGNGHGRLHPYHHRHGIQDPGHGRDVREHSADEGVDHFERGDVDQHAAGAVG